MKLISKVCLWSTVLILLISGCKDDCKDIVCENGGTCVEGSCECTPEFEGNRCELIDLSRFLGTYSATYEGCFTTAPGQKVKVGQVTHIASTLEIIDLGDYQCPTSSSLTILATVSATGIVIAEQTVCEDGNFTGYTFSGSGSKTGNTITLDFTVVYDADGTPRKDECKATLIEE